MSNSATAFDQDAKKQETLGAVFRIEELRSDSSLYAGYAERPYNPDEVAKKKPPFGIYDEMRRDDQVKAVLWLKKFMVLSSGWEITSEDDTQETIVEEIKENLTELDAPDFGEALLNILSYLDYGFSISEPVFDLLDTPGGVRIGITKLKTRAPHTFTLHTDEFGNLREIEQINAMGSVKVSPDRFVYLTHQAEFGIPYGISDLQAAYRAWFSKDKITKFWNIYLERFGNPLVVVTVPTNTSKDDKDRLIDIMKNLQAKTGIVLPDGSTLEVVAAGNAQQGFEAAINSYNMMISRSMLVPDLIGIGGGGITGGSFALGEKHFEMFFMTIEKLRRDLERVVNRKVVSPLKMWNYGLAPNEGPIWKIKPAETKEKLDFLRLWSEAVKGNIWDPSDEEINTFRRMIKFPEGPVKRKEVQPPKGPFPFRKAFKKKSPVTFSASRELTPCEKRVDFSKIETQWDQLAADGLASLRPTYDKVREGLIDMVQSKKIIEGKKFDIISDLSLKFLKDLQLTWRTAIRQSMSEGKVSAAQEMAKAKKDDRQLFTADYPTIAEILESSINERSYFITGLERDKLKKQASLILNRVIEQGLSTKEAVFQLGKLFDDYSAADLETIIRTEMTRAFNIGRKVIFEREEQDGFVEAYQYSAIIDSRTSDICRTLDGKTYLADDPYVDKIIPPRHFNCRSLLVPVIQGDGYEIDKHAVSEEALQSFDGGT